SGQNQV
ncbi:hypothetical protein EC80569_0499, partial [Escherichia coli 8.0569]